MKKTLEEAYKIESFIPRLPSLTNLRFDWYETTPYDDIEKVVVNDNVIVILLKDGREGKSTCSEEDNFDPEVGIAIAYMKAKFGGKKKYIKFVDRAVKKKVWFLR